VSIKLYLTGADRYVEQLLTRSGMKVVCITADDLRELALPNAPQPEAVVLDLRRDPRLPDELWTLRRRHATPVIVITAALDPTQMLEAMRAGVSECVAEPLSSGDLQKAINRVLGQQPAVGSGLIYAFVGAKGGAGSTTLAVNTASVISRALDEGKVLLESQSNVLLVDLHVTYGDCAVFLGAEPKFSIADALENSHRFDDAFFRGVVSRTRGGTDLLPSSDRLMLTPADSRRIQALIEFASYRYRYLVLDVARSDSVVLDALSPVTTFVVVVSQDLATLRSGRGIASALRHRYGNGKVQVVLNRQDGQAEITREDVEQAIGEKLAFVFPSDYRAAVQAINRGVPLVVDDQGKLPAAITQFARRLGGLKDGAPTAAAERGWSGMFARLVPKSLLGE
jgi:pilus assembly protein CpaE